MLTCKDCGWIGEHEELRRVDEPRGEFLGVPCTERMYYCPVCGSDYIDDYIPGQEDDEDDME